MVDRRHLNAVESVKQRLVTIGQNAIKGSSADVAFCSRAIEGGGLLRRHARALSPAASAAWTDSHQPACAAFNTFAKSPRVWAR